MVQTGTCALSGSLRLDTGLGPWIISVGLCPCVPGRLQTSERTALLMVRCTGSLEAAPPGNLSLPFCCHSQLMLPPHPTPLNNHETRKAIQTKFVHEPALGASWALCVFVATYMQISLHYILKAMWHRVFDSLRRGSKKPKWVHTERAGSVLWGTHTIGWSALW